MSKEEQLEAPKSIIMLHHLPDGAPVAADLAQRPAKRVQKSIKKYAD